MSDRTKIEAVASGMPYRVTSVAGHPPERLEDFAADGVVTVTVAGAGSSMDISGPARMTDHHVVLYEKDGAGTGKDLRTWHIRDDGDGFRAEEAAIF